MKRMWLRLIERKKEGKVPPETRLGLRQEKLTCCAGKLKGRRSDEKLRKSQFNLGNRLCRPPFCLKLAVGTERRYIGRGIQKRGLSKPL